MLGSCVTMIRDAQNQCDNGASTWVNQSDREVLMKRSIGHELKEQTLAADTSFVEIAQP